MAEVSIRNIDISFGLVTVLKDLNLDIASGEFIVLLGPSGCGKSTLLNAIAGLIDVSAGQIWIGGNNVTWEEPKDRGIGMVFQSYALYPRMSVQGNLSFGLKMAKVPKDEIERRVQGTAKMLKIDPLMTRKPAELSGGQRQRVAIGRALVRDVDVFLFDEPLSNLDAALRTELRVELKKLHQDLGGSTMIYVTHDQVEALTLADRIAVMQGGKIQQLDTPKTIYHRPANRFVAGFVGSPKMNFLTGRIDVQDAVPVFKNETTTIGLDGYGFGGDAVPGSSIDLGIRPEHIRLGADGATHRATVTLVEPMGAETVVWCAFHDGTLGIRVDGETDIAAGDDLPIAFPGNRLNLFDSDSGLRL